MNILFVTILRINDIEDRGIYPDLMRKFCREGHKVFILTPNERRYKQGTTLVNDGNVSIVKVRTLNIQKTNVLEKWLGTLLINYQYSKTIKKYFPETTFDLIIYSTPPITFTPLIKYVRRRDNAVAYLLLKDIFPQNAVDLGLINKKGIMYKYMRRLERKLYEISDYIGCMSQANVDYLIENNPDVDPHKIEVNPNSHELFDEEITDKQKISIREKYNLPMDATVFIYGGNLGKPQGVDFIIDFLNTQKGKPDTYFIIIGSGMEYNKIENWINNEPCDNIMLLKELAKNEYNMLVQSCDVGMIFLDKRFTIPNFPSRILSFMEYKMPVIAATDTSTDLGKIIQENNFGLWSEAGDTDTISENVMLLANNKELRKELGLNGYKHFNDNYTVDISYRLITAHFTNI
ncbi:MAG TPA: glycosyltransferase WbuB [Bacteroidetes bacterium]|nr:glycosyltransferase WbuB [Bacteroidota bacterium]